MTSSRVYRRALPLEVALSELAVGSGAQFDPGLVAMMLSLVKSGELLITDDEEPEALDASQNGTDASSNGHLADSAVEELP